MAKRFSLAKAAEFRLKLYPRNYQKSLSFYRDILSFSIRHQWDEANSKGVMFDSGSGIIELLDEGDQKQPSGCDLSLEVKDVWKLFEHLKKKSKVIFPIRNNPWGDTSFCIADPSGFQITFFTKTKK